MSQITIYLDNSDNSPDTNPPGYNMWVGGQSHGDPQGIKVQKTDNHLAYTFTNDVSYLLTWYYEWGWISGQNLSGPFTDQQVIKLPKVVGGVASGCCIPWFGKK